MEISISGFEQLETLVDAIPPVVQKGIDKGIRKATSQARALLKQRMSYQGGTTPLDMLGRGSGYARSGIRSAIFRQSGAGLQDLSGRVYVTSKGFDSPTPGNITYINVAGSQTRTRGGVLPARDFFRPVQEAVRGFAGDMIDAAIADALAKPLLESL